MKRTTPPVLLVVALLVFLPTAGAKMNPLNPEIAAVEFTEWVKLADVFLKGTYRIVHDPERMERGEPCFAVYGPAGKGQRLIRSFHCEPIQRRSADQFTVVTVATSGFRIKEVVEIQFPGSAVGHRIRY